LSPFPIKCGGQTHSYENCVSIQVAIRSQL